MAKKIFIGLVLASVIAGMASAQEGGKWYNSYAPGIDSSNLLINAGIGWGILPYDMSLPPLSASIEYSGLKKIPLSFGAYYGIAMYDQKVAGTKWTGTMMGIGARAAWHFNFARNLDTYVGLNLGWMIYNQKQEYTILWPNEQKIENEYDLSSFYYAFNLGVRWFFIKNLGLYAEVGYSPISVASAGITLKF
ncbi:MAG: porin family protein [Spirochaetaceae bacterium]|jgi:hypothetical protein|nr:porin family protein [Spirochaetaceae bacterium]